MMESWTPEGGYMNHILYRMCAEQSRHNNPVVVAGKLELVGRAYSAAPSRGTKIDKFYADLAEAVVEQHVALDAAITEAHEIKQPSLDGLPLILKAHALLNGLVVDFINSKIPGGGPRSVNHRISFCSKYLHFHVPTAVPIYDSIAQNALQDRLKAGQFEAARRHSDFAGTYAVFCRKLIAYASATHSEDWTPRSVDAELYGYDATNTRNGLDARSAAEPA